MKPGLVSISLRQLSPAAVIQATLDSGLSGIEWGGDVHVPHGDLKTATTVSRLTRDAGLAAASYGSYYRFEECDLETETGGPSMQSVLDTAEALGAPAIRVWAGRRGPEKTSDRVREAIVTRAREFAEAASKRGMRLDFEFHDNTLTETPASTARLIGEIGHPAAHTLWQPPLQTSPDDRLDGLRQVKAWISNIHCNHFGQDPWPDIHPLAEGAAEWRTYLDELKNGADDRWILIEHVMDHSVENLKRDAQALRDWLAQ